MKKVLLFLALAMSFMACEGPMGPMGPTGLDGFDGQDGRDGQDGKDGKDGSGGATWLNKTFTIQPNEWTLVGEPNALDSYFVVEKSLPELSEMIYNEKAVIAYFQTKNGQKNGMPFVFHTGEVGSDGKEYIWTETFDYDFSVGKVRFFLTYSDFNTLTYPDQSETFHIVLLW